MKTYEFNMLNRDNFFDLAQEVVEVYQHTWTTRFEMELLEEAQDILDQVWRDREENIAWADSVICSR